MQQNKILLASTFRHYFLGITLALKNKNIDYHIIFIDQLHTGDKNPLLQFATEKPHPFKSVSTLPNRESGLNKRAYRFKCFSILKSIILKLHPIEICTGNDRRLEFQYAMQFARKENSDTIGSYIEDGTGTYIQQNEFNLLKYIADRYIDTRLKKLAYGSWYSHPKQLGTSHWIDKSYLTFPEASPMETKKQPHEQLDAEQYKSQEALTILNTLSTSLGFEERKERKEITLLVLPHHSIIEVMYGSIKQFKIEITSLLKQNNNIYVKYHPRDLNDPYKLKGHCTILPTAVPAELYLATLNINHVIGDISTAMMSAKWIKPACKVQYIWTDSKLCQLATPIFNSIGIFKL